ncbi:MAG: cytochrome c oxidase subunit I [Trichormus sp. ATA11-4-KO1]|jgi:cytochrome c oxidase subunit 1|nr:cytochrome c oxidase subunit I [Trichormus sp. ATA11-4-KO1]
MTQIQVQETANIAAHGEELPVRNWREYFSFSTDHKVIGIQYLVTSFVFYLFGGALATLIRSELATPESDLVSPEFYSGLFTLHGTVMIFLWIIPAGTGGFGNFLVPLLIGARDMAFPRLNAIAFWLVPPAGLLLLASFFVDPPQAGWTSYPPLSLIMSQAGEAMWIFSLILLGTSSIMAGLNFLVTILKMRTPGMRLNQMPLFCWAMLGTSGLTLLATPVLAAALILLAFDLLAGTTFYNPTGGGDPVVYQHMFWYYSHPAVYIMILPVQGMISEILPVHARKPIFGYLAVAYSSIAIACLSLIVWAHHMFTTGTPGWVRMFFMITTMVIAVPTGIKVFSWLGTLWSGKIHFRTAMLFAMGLISVFVIGGISGVMTAAVPFDIHVHDSYFVVAHLHYVLFGGSVFGLYAGIYHWFPKMTGRMLDETLGKIHFVLTYIGFNLAFFPMHELGMQGMRRRIAVYDPKFADLNLICSIGAVLLAISTLPFLVNVCHSWLYGKKAPDNPWQGLTFEWMTTSPPPPENFKTQPVLAVHPYHYGVRASAANGRSDQENPQPDLAVASHADDNQNSEQKSST